MIPSVAVRGRWRPDAQKTVWAQFCLFLKMLVFFGLIHKSIKKLRSYEHCSNFIYFRKIAQYQVMRTNMFVKRLLVSRLKDKEA